jgi:hypothetical protein
MRERLEMLQSVEPYIGRFYSDGWVRKNILKQSEKEMEEIAKEMAKDPTPPTEDETQ